MESSTAFCGQCGAQVRVDAKFCPACGASQTPLTTEQPTAAATPRPKQETKQDKESTRAAFAEQMERVETVAPGASELGAELAARLKTPGVITAGLVGGITAAACLVVGLVLALVVPESTFTGALGTDAGTFAEILRDAIGLTGAHFADTGADGGTAILPATGLLVPLVASFVAAGQVRARTTGLPTLQRLAWVVVGGAFVAAIAMVVLSLILNGQEDDGQAKLFSAFVATFVVVGAGAAAGLVVSGRRSTPQDRFDVIPPDVMRWVSVFATPLRGLAALLLVATALTLVHTEFQTLRGENTAQYGVLGGFTGGEDSDGGRGIIAATIENFFYTPNFALTTTGSALMAKNQGGSGLIVSDNRADKLGEKLAKNGKLRIFSMNGPLPIYIFLPELLLLIGAAVLSALYAGFATSRRAEASTPAVAAAYGASVGVVWALSLTILRELAGTNVLGALVSGATVGGSLFGMALLVGAVGGLIGGSLAARPSAG